MPPRDKTCSKHFLKTSKLDLMRYWLDELSMRAGLTTPPNVQRGHTSSFWRCVVIGLLSYPSILYVALLAEGQGAEFLEKER